MNATQLIGALVGFLFLQGLMGFFWWYLKSLKKPSNGKSGNAGMQSTDFWQKFFTERDEGLMRIIKETVEEGIHNAMLSRTEQLRNTLAEPIMREVKETRHLLREVVLQEAKDTRHDIRNIISEGISRAYLIGKGNKVE